LRAKDVHYENVASVEQAHGEWVLVAGLSNGEGAAAQLLKAGNRTVPQTPEALTVWKTEFANHEDRRKKTVWVLSGFDDPGLMYALLDVADRIGWSGRSKKSPQ